MTTPRPLSPHLQVYRPQISSMMSIFHRITGVALFGGLVLMIAWLWALAYDGEAFSCWQDMAGHWAAKILLVGWTFALFYHMGNGLRHLFWDIGRGFELDTATRSGVSVILFASIMTLGIWLALFQKGLL